ncbi:hypothetical protein HY491_00695 [Candidatus Woesearchaeota archaeon]|nr:hypothetical protein [Candidatus Woesearchaeota archaeon]
MSVILNLIPLLLMIAAIPLFQNDYILTMAYALIIAFSFLIRYEQRDAFFFIFGFIIMTLAEYLFVSTGVETFVRNTLFGVMPVWLPFLWGYAFVAMKRTIALLSR